MNDITASVLADNIIKLKHQGLYDKAMGLYRKYPSLTSKAKFKRLLCCDKGSLDKFTDKMGSLLEAFYYFDNKGY